MYPISHRLASRESPGSAPAQSLPSGLTAIGSSPVGLSSSLSPVLTAQLWAGIHAAGRASRRARGPIGNLRIEGSSNGATAVGVRRDDGIEDTSSRAATVSTAGAFDGKHCRRLRAGARYSPASMLPGLVRTMRPHQWVKNLFVLAPLVFARELTNLELAAHAFAGFACFCVLSSAVYVLNDLLDVDADRAHPTKKNRPIASRTVSVDAARSFFVVLLVIAIAGSALLGMPFLLVAMGYLTNNLAYSFGMKKVAYLDVLSIAGGFELRVLAGAFAAAVPASSYLLVFTFLLACFLGLGKRRHELAHVSAGQTRAALRAYDPRIVTGLLGLTGLATVVVYTIYTLDQHTIAMFGTPYLVVTSAFMLVGVARFVQLTQKTDADSPTDAMLKDKLFVATFLLGAVCVVALIYAGC